MECFEALHGASDFLNETVALLDTDMSNVRPLTLVYVSFLRQEEPVADFQR